MGDCKATAELLHLLIESHGIDTVMDHVEGRVYAPDLLGLNLVASLRRHPVESQL